MRRAWILLLLAGCSADPGPPERTPPPVAPAVAERVPAIRVDRANDVRESNAVALGMVGGSPRAFVADEDDGAIVEIDLTDQKVVASSSIGSRVRDVLVLADGRIAATLPDAGAVVVLARDMNGALFEEKRIRPGEEPLALAADREDRRLFVTTGASHALVELDAFTFAEKARWSLGREPRAALVTGDGARVIVTHASETFASILEPDGKIVQRDIGNRELCSGGDCSGRRFARNAQSIVRVGERGIVIPAAQMLPVPPKGVTKRSFCNSSLTKPRGYGFGNDEAGPPAITDVVAFDDSDGSSFGNGVPSFSGPQCLLPRAAAAAGDDVLVACLGSARVIRYRGTKVFDFAHAKHGTPIGYWHDGVIVNVATDVITVPSGPSGIATARDGKRAWVWSSFARTLTPIDVAKKEALPSIHVARAVARDEAWLAGRELFFTNGDKRISRDGRACGSCHVDGRDDGLAWDTPLGKRRTRLLAGQTTTAPFGWTGENPTLDAHVKKTFEQLGGTGLPDAERTQLLAFVSSLPKPPSSPSSDPDAVRGREVFAAADCGGCHLEGASDRVVHDVGTGGAFLTPTLSGIGTRGRLMHDGRHRSLDELLVSSTAMGKGSTLSVEDRRALVRYLATL